MKEGRRIEIIVEKWLILVGLGVLYWFWGKLKGLWVVLRFIITEKFLRNF